MAFAEALRLPCSFFLISLFLLLTSCTSVRPIIKIGLIAPFEGLYRESGYTALAAMRQAIAECTPPGLQVMPVALDDGGDPAQAQRAAQKLLVDPAVHAIVGPLQLSTVSAVSTVMAQTPEVPWYLPSMIAPSGDFASPQSSAWLEAQINIVTTTTAAERILLLGLPAEWNLQVNADASVVRIDDLDEALATIEAEDAILWLGRPDSGVRWFSVLRQQQPNLEFWLANQAGLDVFAAYSADLDPIHWLVWTDSGYNDGLQSADFATQAKSSTHELTYRATCVALQGLVDSPTAATTDWPLQSHFVERPAR